MPRFNSYSEHGRELLVRFTCTRCGKTHTEELEPLDKKAGDHYGNLGSLPLPKGWSSWLLSSLLLCDTCTAALNDFLKPVPEKGEEGPTDDT